MTPKEKAKELYNKYDNVLPDAGEISKFDVQQCALITVNKMLNDHLSNKTTKYGRERYHFWQQVKHEIKSYDNK